MSEWMMAHFLQHFNFASLRLFFPTDCHSYKCLFLQTSGWHKFRSVHHGMARIDVWKIVCNFMVWGDLENDKWHVSAKLGWNRRRKKERNSICHKNENCFTRQLTLHSIFRAETAHSLVWHWSLSAIYQKRLLTRFSKHFKRHWEKLK